MEFLKSVMLIALIFIASISIAQTQQQLQEAFSKSFTLESSKKYGDAIAQITSVYSESSYEANLRLGWLYYLNGNFEKSITYYKKSISLMPVATEPLWGILKPYVVKKDWVNVESTYKSILKLDSKNSSANYWMGSIFYNRKDYASAKKYLDISLNLNPFDYDILILSAWTNYFLGNMSQAKILFNKALLNHPNDASALEGLALIK